jgi:hypothetical protein
VRVVERPGEDTGAAADGTFTLKLPAGTYTLEAIFLGYKVAARQVVLPRNQRVAFRLVRRKRRCRPVSKRGRCQQSRLSAKSACMWLITP